MHTGLGVGRDSTLPEPSALLLEQQWPQDWVPPGLSSRSGESRRSAPLERLSPTPSRRTQQLALQTPPSPLSDLTWLTQDNEEVPSQ